MDFFFTQKISHTYYTVTLPLVHVIRVHSRCSKHKSCVISHWSLFSTCILALYK